MLDKPAANVRTHAVSDLPKSSKFDKGERCRVIPRVHAEGLLYHVMARGNDGQKIFLRQSDYQAFIEALRSVRQRYPFSLYAYVLMSNHFHLLVHAVHGHGARDNAVESAAVGVKVKRVQIMSLLERSG